MANDQHLRRLLDHGVDDWNRWREENPKAKIDLAHVNLAGADLRRINLAFADLRGADLDRTYMGWSRLAEADLRKSSLREAGLFEADLTAAIASDANLTGANLLSADLVRTDFRRAILRGADLRHANAVEADLSGADLSWASLVTTNFTRARLNGCRVYGLSAWDVTLDDAEQKQLVITPGKDLPGGTDLDITVDHLEMAQFIYLLLHNRKIRDVIDTITSKVVLILGRFTEARKAVLDAIREELRKRDFTPVLFDFAKPLSKDVTGTVETLARMARFVIADLTDPSSIPHELATIVPSLRTTPVLPIRMAGSGGYSMFDDFRVYPWVLPTYEYRDGRSLIEALSDVIAPAEKLAQKFRRPPKAARIR